MSISITQLECFLKETLELPVKPKLLYNYSNNTYTFALNPDYRPPFDVNKAVDDAWERNR